LFFAPWKALLSGYEVLQRKTSRNKISMEADLYQSAQSTNKNKNHLQDYNNLGDYTQYLQDDKQ